MNINWIIDADVSGLFDNLDHRHLREFIQKRVNDGGVKRLIGKWLKAGVIDNGAWTRSERGTPQGGVISPLLANIFLHYVLDEWFENVVQPCMHGRCFIICYADEFIIGLESREDARRVMDVLPKRFARYGLAIHPEKTKLVCFGRPSSDDQSKHNETFDFLGFTHFWAKSRQGKWIVKRKTIGKRLSRFVKTIWQWCRINRHEPVYKQHETLCSKLRGYYQYYGVNHNYRSLHVVLRLVKLAWQYWLSRRCHAGIVRWDKFQESLMEKYPLLLPRIVHQI